MPRNEGARGTSPRVGFRETAAIQSDSLGRRYKGASGYQRAEHHQAELTQRGIPHSFRQEFDGGWTLRFGPLSALQVASALSAFVY